MKAAITFELYAQVWNSIDCSPYLSWAEFLTALNVDVLNEEVEGQTLNYRQLRILAVVMSKGEAGGLNTDLLYDHFRATGDETYTREAYLADVEGLVRLSLVFNLADSLLINFISLSSGFTGEATQPSLGQPFPPAAPFSPSFTNSLSPVFPPEGISSAVSLSLLSEADRGAQLLPESEASASSSDLAPSTTLEEEVAEDQQERRRKKRKRKEAQEEGPPARSSSYAKILEELSFVRQENWELRQTVDAMRTELTQLTERLFPVSSSLEAGFFGGFSSASSVAPLPPPPRLSFKSSLGDFDEEVDRAPDALRLPSPFN
jgi:hypothetical protein